MKRELIDIVKSVRQLKSQISIIRGLKLEDNETKLIENALTDLRKEIDKTSKVMT